MSGTPITNLGFISFDHSVAVAVCLGEIRTVATGKSVGFISFYVGTTRLYIS